MSYCVCLVPCLCLSVSLGVSLKHCIRQEDSWSSAPQLLSHSAPQLLKSSAPQALRSSGPQVLGSSSATAPHSGDRLEPSLGQGSVRGTDKDSSSYSHRLTKGTWQNQVEHCQKCSTAGRAALRCVALRCVVSRCVAMGSVLCCVVMRMLWVDLSLVI